MKVLLIGNYPYLKSQSMDRFARVLCDGLKSAGHQVRLLKPLPVLGRIFPSATGIGKWLGYLDRFLLFYPLLMKSAAWADVLHICDQANAVYTPFLNRSPHVVTCHDMNAVRSAFGDFAQNPTGTTGKVYQKWILSGIAHARHVVCVSKSTYRDVLRMTELETNRVSLIPNGLNYPYRRMDKTESLHYLKQIGVGTVHPFFIHVGGNYWYKNKEGLLRIFGRLIGLEKAQPLKLVMAGERLNHQLRFSAEQLGISDRIIEAPNVTNQQLCALYSSAEGLIFPSLAEGFGWPIIEAQTCGCPVFTSSRDPMKEIGGNAAIYFDPMDEIGAAETISKSIHGRDGLRKRGYKNAMRYSTMDMISNYIGCYRLVQSQ